MQLHGLTGWRPSNDGPAQRKAVWLQVKLRGRGLGLRSLYARSVYDTKAPLQLWYVAYGAIQVLYARRMISSYNTGWNYRRQHVRSRRCWTRATGSLSVQARSVPPSQADPSRILQAPTEPSSHREVHSVRTSETPSLRRYVHRARPL